MKMKRLLFLLGGLFLQLTINAQVYQIPEGYEAEFSAAEEKVHILKKAGFDYVLDPSEQVAIEASFEDLQSGNWANDYLKTILYNSSLNYKRVCVGFIHDTAGELDHQYLNDVAYNELAETFTGEPSPKDGHSHGTHVAGCVGASGYSAPLGVAGDMAEDEYLRLVAHKCLNNGGAGYHSWIAKSIRRGVEKGKVLQNQGHFVFHVLSLGGSSDNPEVAAAIQEARAAGQLVIVAAGNSGGTPPAFPGRAEGSLCTAALQKTADGAIRASYSQYGNQMFMAAPGSNILSTVPGNGLKKYSGTSMAAPTLAGMAAKLASHYHTATAYQIEQMLGLNATPVGADGWNKYTGWGAPILNKYLGKNINNYKDEPLKPGNGNNPPDDGELEREKRKLTYYYDDYMTIWRTISGTASQRINVSFIVTFETKLYDDAAYDLVAEANQKFFTNRGFILRDHHGFSDATFWIRHFYEMIVNRDERLKEHGIKVKVETIYGLDQEQRQAQHDRRWTQQLGARIKRLAINAPMTIETF